MRIVIDCRFIGKSGIGTYIESVIDCILRLHLDHDYLFITEPGVKIQNKAGNVEILETNIKPFSLRELFFFPVAMINKYDVYYSPNYNVPLRIKVPIFITVHDVIFLDRREMTSYFGYLIRKVYLSCSICRSKRIFTVSFFSKKRIIHYFKCHNISVTYSAISNDLMRFHINEDYPKGGYFIFVGNVKKHKGLDILIDAYHRAVNNGLKKKMLIVGQYDKFKTGNKEIVKKIDTNGIEFTGYVDNALLYQYIKGADALILPSRYEGFGLPPLESLYLGTNVILSDIEALKEIYCNLPVKFFKDGDSYDLCKVMMNFNVEKINIKEVRKKIESMYTFERIADKIMSTIELDICK